MISGEVSRKWSMPDNQIKPDNSTARHFCYSKKKAPRPQIAGYLCVAAKYKMRMNKEVQKYFASVPDDRIGIVTKLHELIIGLYPDVVVDMSYKMPTYKVKNGWVALANQKYYVSLYTCGAHHIAEFKEKYPAIKTGKGCINFKSNDPIPVAALKKVVRHAIQNPK